MNTLAYILKKWNLHQDYIEIPNVGRDDLVKIFKELKFSTGVEVGVASGEYSKVIMDTNPNIKMWGVDPYTKYEGYKDYQLRATFEKMEKAAHEKLDKYPFYCFLKEFSVQASNHFADDYLDFVYIDGNHAGESVKEDIEAWAPKVRSGGIVAGHDFTGRWPSLRNEVISYCKKNKIQLFVLGMERKDLGLYRDTSRSWFFVKR